MDVSVIIVNYNTKNYIIDCINSVIQKTKDINYEIIIVDNNSYDDSVNEIKKKFPITGSSNITIVENKENLGFGMANNEGFKRAQGKYLFCLNPDTILLNNAVKILCDFMESHKECAASGGNLYDKNNKPVHSFGYGDDIKSLLLRKTLLKYFFPNQYIKIKNYEKFIDRTKITEVNHITGADLMLRKSAIDQIGGFFGRFFMYFEETELEVRLKRAGYEIYFVPEAKIIHFEGVTKNKESTFYYKNSIVEYYKTCYGEAWGEIAELLVKRNNFK